MSVQQATFDANLPETYATLFIWFLLIATFMKSLHIQSQQVVWVRKLGYATNLRQVTGKFSPQSESTHRQHDGLSS